MAPISSARNVAPATRVRFVDLAPTNGPLRDRILARIAETVDRGDFANGAAVAEFERQFAAYVGRVHCVGVASGLDALRLSLLATGVARDGRVIVPASTFAATFEAVLQAGGAPVVVDVSEVDYALDLRAAAAVADGASHVVPVHLYGQMADMRELVRLSESYGVQIVEDACQAHGARRDGIAAGSAGRVAAFSFYPAKNLGAFGDAGALVTDDDEIATHARALRQHGETGKYHHDFEGYTARLDTIQAIVLSEKLPLLDEWNAERRRAAQFYADALADLDGLRLPSQPPGSDSVWHLYVVRTSDPDGLAAFLAERGIESGRHYPEPPHVAPAYRELGYQPGDFPVAEALAREALSLPLYAGIAEAQLDEVCTAVRLYFSA
jgi:dTDP-4-amino-4,6-dideoxygalactose transaminase